MFRRFFLALTVFSLILSVAPQVAEATIIYVKAGSSGSGTSWTNAYGSLSTALGVAGSSDEVWVAVGTYKPGTSRSSSFTFNSTNNGVEVYGGFRGLSGDEGINNSTTRPPDPDPTTPDAATDSILSGDLNGDDGPLFTNRTENCYHVVRAASVDNTTRLEGFTIKSGFGDSANSVDRIGAGITITGTNSSPRIINSTITDCKTLWIPPTGPPTGQGGGIASSSNGNSPTFTNCLVSNNQAATHGGGVYLATPFHATFTSCAFSGNKTSETNDTGGGALFTTVTGNIPRTVELESCTFDGNSTKEAPGGAIYHSGDGNTLEAKGCVFESNTANVGSGGALFVTSGGATVLKNSVFSGNECTLPTAIIGGGGAVAIESSAGIQNIVNSRFYGNTTVAVPGATPKLLGGALFSNSGVDGLAVTNCVFSGNSTDNGGAAHCGPPDQSPTYVLFTNVTAADNYANETIGGLSVGNSQTGAKFRNCICWNNADSTGSGSDAQLGEHQNASATVDVTYSCIMGGDYTTNGNIDSDPCFVDPGALNYRIVPTSPCADVGDNSALTTAADPADLNTNGNLTEPTPFDLDLLARRVADDDAPDGGGTSPIVDMGAYEVGCQKQGDVNGDTYADGRDIAPFIACVLSSSTTCPCGDLNLDGVVNISDIPCFVNLLVAGTPCLTCGVFTSRAFADCNTNGVADINDIFNGTSQDCNHNDVPDECDLDAGDPDGNEQVSADVNSNGVPDECEPDCNHNSIPDAWDISQATSDDVNANGVPDECEADCNTNGVPDSWDISQQTSADCNMNGTPDECEADCNTNGVPDDCDIDPNDPDGNESVSADCNGNGWPDECDMALPGGWGSLDCNTNGIPDECDIASCESDPACGDCNENGIPDGCDIAAHVSTDANTNGIPDECEGEGMMGGGSQMMMSGGEGGEGTDGSDPHPDPLPEGEREAAWEAFYEWAAAQCWGPACEDPTDVQFAAMVAKLQELGLPVSGRPMMP